MESIGLDEVLAWIRQIAARIEEQRGYLTELDSAIGDADHGINMNRGFKAVLEKLESSPPTDIAGALRTVAMTLIGKVGGASGPLYGTMFIEMSKAVGDDDRIDAARFAELLRAGIDGVIARGKAEEGDKTMIDALEAAYRAISESVASGADLSEAVEAAVEGAKEGMEATIPMVARKGRASYLGERSAGHQDPGATSSHLILAAASETWR
ncbi:MAG TPA: dihydroxyacetone kinase subunit DhaL [Acidimicrobiia bacterium]|nr:dihydroxyacetone kinase subunit DhaL [Acidimicrobiia bacterium]